MFNRRLLSREELSKINILDFLLDISALVPDAFDIILNMENGNVDFIYQTALIYLKGECQLFAFALKDIFPDYNIRYFTKGNLHIFCEYNDVYIDVRGVMDTTEELANPFGSVITREDVFDYVEGQDDWLNEYSNIGYIFATEIIKNNIERYKAENQNK